MMPALHQERENNIHDQYKHSSAFGNFYIYCCILKSHLNEEPEPDLFVLIPDFISWHNMYVMITCLVSAVPSGLVVSSFQWSLQESFRKSFLIIQML